MSKVLVTDSRLLERKVIQPVLRGCNTILYKQWQATGSATSINFTCPTPSQNCEIDRNINIVVPVRLTFTKTNVPAGTYLLNPNLCNLRSFPIHKALSQMRMTLNNHTVTLSVGNILSALEHFNTNPKLKNLEFSKTSTYGCCQTQNFSDIPSGSRSELSLYDNSISGLAAQMFPFTVISQTTPAGPGVGTATSVVEFVSTEALMVSPCFWGDADNNIQAFVGIKTMDFQFDFLPNAGNRMFAVDRSTIDLGATGVTTVDQRYFFTAADNFSYPETKPLLLVQYLQPQQVHPKGYISEHPYFQIDQFSSPQLSAVSSLARSTLSSAAISLPRLPSKIFIFARKPMSTFLSDPFSSDAFMSIESISVNWNTRNVLSSCHRTQLYDISVKNGIQLDYTAWSGLGIADATSAPNGFAETAHQYYGTGSIICLDPLDLGLSDDMSQYPQRQIALQIDVNVRNISGISFTPELMIVTLTDGLLKIEDGVVTSQLGIIETKLDQPITDKDPSVSQPISQRKKGYMGEHFISLKHLFKRK